MKTTEFTIVTRQRTELQPITAHLTELVRQHGWQDGVLTIFVPHTTAGITINENADPDVARDMTCFFDELVPQSSRFRHAEGNSDAHIKAALVGSSVQVMVRDGYLWLGTWQGIYFCEFDGPRNRSVRVCFQG
ncbi:MAG: YjbQ family protein [Geobacter sp.]|nr:YjbQ family protein [Geobacter sp.]